MEGAGRHGWEGTLSKNRGAKPTILHRHLIHPIIIISHDVVEKVEPKQVDVDAADSELLGGPVVN